jgi:CBS-domain-containing membrane protein
MREERPGPFVCAFRALGAGIAIAIMEFLAAFSGLPLPHVPFVTSIVLVMALPSSDAAQPRAIIGGHFLSCACGLACFWSIGPGETSSAIAVGVATLSMIACRAIHPPAGIDAFLVPADRLSVF